MYQNNIYIKNHDAVKAMGGDINVCLDKYDNAHGLYHALGACAVQTLASRSDRRAGSC